MRPPHSVTLIMSDFHMGGGPSDPGDDFVHQSHAFERFLADQLATPEGRAGGIELILNGDTFELAQVRADVYHLGSATYWCSQDESLEKLQFVIEGHQPLFAALRRFGAAGNTITMAPGNHDVELYWPRVRTRLEEAIGPINFELGMEWYERYEGKLAVAHGHLRDPANRFEHWDRPVLDGPYGERLEMCPGTLFMVKFVNPLEKDYPFADNLHPVTAIAEILAKDRVSRLAPVAWLLTRFAALHPSLMLEVEDAPDHYDGDLRRDLQNPLRVRELAQRYRAAVAPSMSDERLRAVLASRTGLVDTALELFAALPLDEWLALMHVPPSTLSLDGASDGTLAVIKSGRQHADLVLREAASARFDAGATVVVMGHTHQPDELATGKGVYFNTGSWTRYVSAASLGLLTLEDLKNEESFPYQLNYVRVEPQANGDLTARMVAFEQKVGVRFGQRLNL